ncbi:MAG: glycine cleavage system protein GcvH [Magnetococcales bacterium]|nr:glycine cleavage system protein GcvH [Magnetococcales bacterium]MBF0151999.1 glycine cleavage system protein GcvH [Magnetococcales bacterium]MBF0174945.1 glycine cleavage system protein GcvH [Magnetococcales bacterium]MBF0346828.1 glycine cleavage system protein GcvH [Magnetococcales bacterium]MBF0632899.1 glycine cleavage system protein GcvH [Magnetococcales bacterium]
MELPNDLRYTPDHEWIRQEGTTAVVGITAFATSQLGDVVFVELPAPGTRVTAKQPFGVVESVKSVSDLFAPVSGTVTRVNTNLQESPEIVNDDPYGKGWMIHIQPDNPRELLTLLDANGYQSLLDNAG